MTAPRFFHPAPLARASVGTEIALPDAVAHHAVRVRRLADGDAITLFDGHGGEYAATLVGVDRRSARARVERFDEVERESPFAVTLVPALIATDPMDVLVRKAVELGVAAIEPVIAARSQGGREAERTGRRLVHWGEIAIAACEQCGRNRIPAIGEPVPLPDWIAAHRDPRDAAILAPGAAASLPMWAAARGQAIVLIGPEGGWTGNELAAADGAGLARVHLGGRVLRADTAALAAVAILSAARGDAA